MSRSMSSASPRMAARARLAIIAALAGPALLASCSESPTAPPLKVASEITSGTVPGGQRALFFVTRPMDRRKFAGTFDATLHPQVLICTAVPCVSPVVGPVTIGSTGAATLTLDTVHQSYVFRWRTKLAPLAPNAVYRLVVRVGDYQLGWVDLATGTKQRDLRALDRREFVPLRLGSTLTLPFRIEQGAPFPPDLPGRYESAPDACPDGCTVHGTPDGAFYVVWGAVQITQTGQIRTGLIGVFVPWTQIPVMPAVPAPGTGPLNGFLEGNLTSLDWRYDENNPGCLELWQEGMTWGYWCGTFGGPAEIWSEYSPIENLGSLNRLPNYLPPIQ